MFLLYILKGLIKPYNNKALSLLAYYVLTTVLQILSGHVQNSWD